MRRALCISLFAAGCGSAAAQDPDSVFEQNEEPDAIEAPPRPHSTAEVALDDPPVEIDLPAPSAVPAGDVERPEYVHSTGFFVVDGRLYDRYGNDFVMRGVNNAHAWFDSPGSLQATAALDNISTLGANSVRIVWEALSSNLTAALLERVLNRAVEQRLVPMIELHDVTGPASVEALLQVAAYYTQDDVKAVLEKYEDYLLLNIANEWCEAGPEVEGRNGAIYRPCAPGFLEPYTQAIELLRGAGLRHTLVIDANGWGQNAQSVLDDGEALLEADPEHNLLFSVHMYESYAQTSTITRTFEEAAGAGIPLIVGEFGQEHNGTAIDVEHLLKESSRLGIGVLGWSWKGNSSDLAYLDLSEDWEGRTLTDWGQRLFRGEHGIEKTAQRASLFVLANQ